MAVFGLNRRFRLRSTVAVALLAGTSLGGYALGHESFAADVSAPPASVSAASLPDFTDLAQRVKPAVVTITSQMGPDAADMLSEGQGAAPGAQGMPFPFGMMPGGPAQSAPQRAPMMEAAGSGFIVDANGTVITNNHVVQGAKSVTVTLSDGTILPATVIGRDTGTDIAVLKIHANRPLPYLDFGDSSNVETGQWVVAMGNPFGLGGTVTAGIVSSEGRDIGDGPYDSFLQIDAPINKGNSGGPLFNQAGDVIGMNTAILSPTGGSVGIGFAIPSNTVKSVVAQLIKTGHVTRGFIGVEAQSLNAAMGQALNLPGHGVGPLNGALLSMVVPNSPAFKAGLRPGDVVETVNKVTVHNPRDFAVDIAAIAPGDSANLNIIRNGKAEDVSLHVAELKSRTASNDQPGRSVGQPGRVGLALAPLTPDSRNQLGVPDGTDGAVVAEVTPNSPADQAGIEQGDVVLGVNSRSIGSPDQAVGAIQTAMQANGGAVALRILRQGQTLFVPVTSTKSAG